MVDRHCPFLNRDDPRCAEHFRVNRLQNAFEHCAGAYADCPSYRALLAERIMRRNGEPGVAAARRPRVEVSVGGVPYAVQQRAGIREHRRQAAIVLTAPAARRWSVTGDGLVERGLAAR